MGAGRNTRPGNMSCDTDVETGRPGMPTQAHHGRCDTTTHLAAHPWVEPRMGWPNERRHDANTVCVRGNTSHWARRMGATCTC